MSHPIDKKARPLLQQKEGKQNEPHISMVADQACLQGLTL